MHSTLRQSGNRATVAFPSQMNKHIGKEAVAVHTTLIMEESTLDVLKLSRAAALTKYEYQRAPYSFQLFDWYPLVGKLIGRIGCYRLVIFPH